MTSVLAKSAIVFALLAIFGSERRLEGQEVREIRAPEWASEVSCRRSGAPETPVIGRSVRISCPSNETWSCDALQTEPVDLSGASICSGSELSFRRGEAVSIVGDRATKVEVEWLSGIAPYRVSARRIIEISESAPVSVVSGASGFVRFRRFGVSPITIPARELAAQKSFVLPSRREGGEVLVLLPPNGTVPDVIQVTGGGRTINLVARGGIATAWGVPPGTYKVAGFFEGGLSAFERSVQVRHGDSVMTEAVVIPAGKVTVVGTMPSCAEGSRLIVEDGRLLESGQRQVIPEQPYAEGCRWRIGGLKSGVYRARIRGPLGSGGAWSFTVVEGGQIEVRLPSPLATGEGIVAVNGIPLDSGTLQLSTADGKWSATAQIDSSGRYRVFADQPGRFQAVVLDKAGNRIPQPLSIDLAEGAGRHDLSIVGSTINVSVRGSRSSRETVEVVLENETIRLSSGLKQGEITVSRTGLPPGQYRVFARQTGNSPLSTEVSIVTANKAGDTQSVELTLQQNSATLTLTDSAGKPVGGAKILVRPQPWFRPVDTSISLASEEREGTYSLKRLPAPETVIILARGYQPACVSLNRDEAAAVALTAGQEQVIELSVPIAGGIPPGIGQIGWGQSPGCLVPLSWFSHTRLTPTSAGTSRFKLSGFPGQTAIRWQTRFPSVVEEFFAKAPAVLRLTVPGPRR